MKRTKVVDALSCTDFGNDINVRGWVRSHRNSKAVDFIALNDGSTIKNIQVVVDPSTINADILKNITTGACISVIGTLVESQGKGQTSEIQCKEIEIYGLCPSDYPMQRRGRALSICASTLTYAFAQIHSELFFAFVITWQWQFTSISTSMVSTISIHRLLQVAMLKVREICFKLPRSI